MGDLITGFLHQGIVRVLSVPLAMGAIIWVLWVLAAPREDQNDEGNANA
jgi:hypothetical protein